MGSGLSPEFAFNMWRTDEAPERSGEEWCSRQGSDVMHRCRCRDHVFLFTAHQHWRRFSSPKALESYCLSKLTSCSVFYAYGTSISSQDFCFVFICHFYVCHVWETTSTRPLTPLTLLLCSHIDSFGHYPEFYSGRSNRLVYSRSHIPPLQIISDCPEFPACLNAAIVMISSGGAPRQWEGMGSEIQVEITFLLHVYGSTPISVQIILIFFSLHVPLDPRGLMFSNHPPLWVSHPVPVALRERYKSWWRTLF